MAARRFVLPVVAAIAALLLVLTTPALAGRGVPARRTSGADRARHVAAARGPVVVVAVGDIACSPRDPVTRSACRQQDTADLTRRIAPDAVLALGDLQYPEGTLRAFRRGYGRSWGDLKPITFPVPGNHEYKVPGAAGYYRYLRSRQPGPPGYYATDLGAWRIYALNSNCDRVDCRAERDWLVSDLRKNPHRCSLFTTHHPRYSSGEHGDIAGMQGFFRIAVRHRVDLVLSGHDHHYERFRRMNAAGRPAPRGVMQVVSGAGGRSHYPAGPPTRGSAFIDDKAYGVLRLVLRQDRFRFAFKTVDGRTPDSGGRRCT